MPLTTCPECHRSVSDKAPACPNCGAKLRTSFLRKGMNCGCAGILGAVGLVFGLIFLYWLLGYLL